MPDGSLETRVPANDLNICIADAGADNADQGLAWGLRRCDVVKRQLSADEPECSHRQITVILMVNLMIEEQLLDSVM
jgi:hypothetical protein